MKKIFYLMLAVTAFAFVGCNDDEEPVQVLEIVKSDVGFTADGGNGMITVNTTEGDFKATTDKSWITIEGTGWDKTDPYNKTVSYAVAPYDGALTRSGKITIVAGALTEEVTIMQVGSSFDMSVEPVAVDPAGQQVVEVPFDASSSAAPTVEIPADASWLRATAVEGAIQLIADLNYETPRSTTIKVTQAWKSVEIPVTQGVVNLVTVEEITTGKGAAYEVTITPTEYLPLAAPAWDVTTTADWITIEKTPESFTVTLSENTTKATRTATISLTDGGEKVLRTIPVSQGFMGYNFFLGDYTMPFDDFYGDAMTADVSIIAYEEGESYIIDGLMFPVLAEYVETDTDAYISLTYQYVGKSGSYYVHFCPTLPGDSFTWSSGVGMNIVYASSSQLRFVDNGRHSSGVIGFCVSAFSSATASSSGYLGNFENYDNLTTLTRK